MKITSHKLPLFKTNSFTKVINDFVEKSPNLNAFVTDFPSKEAIKAQLDLKGKKPINRQLLSQVLEKQYEGIEQTEKVHQHILLLEKESTFTICTAHQPNIFTGYLYFIYKIIHVIKLAEECKALYPIYDFVPVYYMGSEDNDIEEIGTFNFAGEKVKWNTTQTGACGRMSTHDLMTMRNEVIETLNPAISYEKNLIELLKKAYDGENSLAEATRILVNGLFGEYGLVVIDGDDKLLKSKFKSIIVDELMNQKAEAIVNASLLEFEKNYHAQAQPRSVNLFYLKDNIRERIEKSGDEWIVLNTEIRFSQDELLLEVDNHSDRFSPNVILRPLYQETILPNVAFVGGGGEVGYWLPLKPLFEFYEIPFPILFLRNSVLLIDSNTNQKMNRLGLSFQDLFSPIDDLIKSKVMEQDIMQKIELHQKEVKESLSEVQALGLEVSINLSKSVEAHLAKIERVQARITQKFIAQLKKQDEIRFNQLKSIKNHLFPSNSLQERFENYFTMVKKFDGDLIDLLFKYQEAFSDEFLVLMDEI